MWGGDDHAHEWGEEHRRKPGQSMAPSASSTLTTNNGRGPKEGDKYHADTEALTTEISQGAFCPCGAWSGALGLEPTPDLYVEHMVEVFREVRRVLRKDGSLWLNLGDSYAGSWGNQGRKPERGTQRPINGGMITPVLDDRYPSHESNTGAVPAGLKPKDMVGIPWRVAFALQADGWYLRSDIIWAKPNPMPESVTDRPTKSHEYVFLLTKSPRYFYDADAIREAQVSDHPSGNGFKRDARLSYRDDNGARGNDEQWQPSESGRNARTVWSIATQPYPGAHFATFPEELPERCIKAGSAAQACSVCGAPWQRVTERTSMGVMGGVSRIPAGSRDIAALDRGKHSQHEREGLTQSVSKTLGFEPTCAHDAPTVGSVVLDPFNGSGTTGRVALRLGRRYVGLDLSREYLAEQALARVDPLTAAARDARKGKSGQQVLGL